MEGSTILATRDPLHSWRDKMEQQDDFTLDRRMRAVWKVSLPVRVECVDGQGNHTLARRRGLIKKKRTVAAALYLKGFIR